MGGKKTPLFLPFFLYFASHSVHSPLIREPLHIGRKSMRSDYKKIGYCYKAGKYKNKKL